METFKMILEIFGVGLGVGVLAAVAVVLFILKVCEWEDEEGGV